MAARMLRAGVLLVVGLAAVACGPGVDLSKALQVSDVMAGYYDAGVKDDATYLVPSVAFRLHNVSDKTVGSVQVTVAFWQEGADSDWDSVVLQGIAAGGLAPGAKTATLVARCPHGYTLDLPQKVSELFTHTLFKDVTAKFFASRAGTITPIGQVKLDHLILPHAD